MKAGRTKDPTRKKRRHLIFSIHPLSEYHKKYFSSMLIFLQSNHGAQPTKLVAVLLFSLTL